MSGRLAGGEKRRLAVSDQADARAALDLLLSLDRMVVEYSLRAYRVPRREQARMRKHHRRLHAAVRQHLTRVMARKLLLPGR